MADGYTVKVILRDDLCDDVNDLTVVRSFTGLSRRKADKIEAGLHRNLNHHDYYTVIEPPCVE